MDILPSYNELVEGIMATSVLGRLVDVDPIIKGIDVVNGYTIASEPINCIDCTECVEEWADNVADNIVDDAESKTTQLDDFVQCKVWLFTTDNEDVDQLEGTLTVDPEPNKLNRPVDVGFVLVFKVSGIPLELE
ncbi:hypothetical protein GGF37_002601 [Kickxella alabastrina]|nr:hypothetical protein GGF37_002601 [Kickxella alabastrina]